MSAARFNVKRRVHTLKSKDFKASNFGGVLDRSYWGVHKEYWIGKIEDSYLGDVDTICFRPGYVKFYNPLTDYPDLFLRFCELGRYDQVQPDHICKFVSKFGLLFDVEDSYWHSGLEDENIVPLMEFYGYAREAYFINKMYSCLMSRRADKLRQVLNDFISWDVIEPSYDYANWVNVMDGKMGIIHVIGEEVASRWNRYVPFHLKIDIEFVSDEDFLEDGGPLEELGLWCINEGPDNILFAAIGHCICKVMGYRLGHITAKMNLRIDQESPLLFSFEPSWDHSSLLSAIWLLFYLKITGQTETKYKICPECNEPIVNPRKNQEYHEKCRKNAYARTRRLAEKMWAEGQTLEAIIVATKGNPDTVKGWIDKLKIKSSEKRG